MIAPPDRMHDPDVLLSALLSQNSERGALALIKTGSLSASEATLNAISSRHKLTRVDLSAVTAPLDADPALGGRRLLTGLSWMRPELRRATAMSLNRARDRVSVLGIQVVLWLLEEDYRWFCEEAPDLANRFQEVLTLADLPMPGARPSELICPMGLSARSTTPAEHTLQWLKSTLSVPGARAAIPGVVGVQHARAVLDSLLVDGRGPAAWLNLNLLDPNRAAQWVGARGDLRIVVVNGGLPPPNLPHHVAVLVCGLDDSAIPSGILRPPEPPAREVGEAIADRGEATLHRSPV